MHIWQLKMQELPQTYGKPWTLVSIGSLHSPDSDSKSRKKFLGSPDQILDPLLIWDITFKLKPNSVS